MNRIVLILCIVTEFIAYMDLRKFLKAHQEETMEHIQNSLTKRVAFLIFVPVATVGMMLLW